MTTKQWPPELEERAEAIIARYPHRRSAVMPLLYMAMQHEGYVTDQAMRWVGEWTGLTPAQVQAVSSFYTMYKSERVGRYLVSVCTSLPCMLAGADDVLAAIEDETGVPAGETDPEGLVSVEHVECIGACAGAPAAQVNYELIEGVSPARGRALCQWLRDGQPRNIGTDEMQQLFGGARSFDWAISERATAVGPVPAFGPYGTTGEDS